MYLDLRELKRVSPGLLVSLQNFRHCKTCVLPTDTFVPALAHQWLGSWLWPAAKALSSQESGVYLFRGASTPGHLVTAVRLGRAATKELNFTPFLEIFCKNDKFYRFFYI